MESGEGLDGWCAGETIPDALYARMIGHPRFGEAARALAANWMAAGESDRALDGIFKDAGRFLAATMAMYLHVSGSLTLPRLKAVCASSGYLSPGRARALLLYMRYLGYAAPARDTRRGEPARYVPTSSFSDAWRSYLAAGLRAACVIEPRVARVLERLDEDAVMQWVSRAQGEGLLTMTRNTPRDFGFIRVFMDRHAGAQILRVLVLEDENDFPPRKALPFSIASLARRFDVSRIHVRRVLDDAVRENLLALNADGSVTLTESMRNMLIVLYATQLLLLLRACARALKELGAPAMSRAK